MGSACPRVEGQLRGCMEPLRAAAAHRLRGATGSSSLLSGLAVLLTRTGNMFTSVHSLHHTYFGRSFITLAYLPVRAALALLPVRAASDQAPARALAILRVGDLIEHWHFSEQGHVTEPSHTRPNTAISPSDSCSAGTSESYTPQMLLAILRVRALAVVGPLQFSSRCLFPSQPPPHPTQSHSHTPDHWQ